MLVNDKFNILRAIGVTGLKFLIFLLVAATVGLSSQRFGFSDYLFPGRLVSIFVGAVGIFLAFRINVGYTRWWKGRQIWGKLIVDSRSLAMYVLSLMRESDQISKEEKELHRKIIHRHIGFINALRLQLRRQAPEEWEEEVWNRKINNHSLFSNQEIKFLKSKSNKATQIIIMQMENVSAYFTNKADFRHVKIAEQFREFYHDQAQSELIKSTVLAWGYVFYTRALVWLLAFMVVFSQINSPDATNIVLVSLISTAFVTIEQVGKNLDNPFENSFNDTPLSTICRLIEIDLLEQLDEPCSLKPLLPKNGRLD